MDVFITDHWNDYLNRFPEKMVDVYYTESYVKLYETYLDEAYCIVCSSNSQIALMPFLRRRVGNYFDFETAYGYGGPIFNDTSCEWIASSLSAIKDYFSNHNYICGFIRFHPLLNNAELCKDYITVLFDRKTITVDLHSSEEDIWNHQIISKNRNMIRKAEKSGLEYRAELDYSSSDSFKNLYNSTMHRLNADEFYFFNDNYFDEYKKSINGFLGVVSLHGKIIGSALFMMYGKYGHYHLAGSDREYSSLGINNFMLWNTIKVMKRNGILFFHLGGGTSDLPDDSLYKFKKAFSSNESDFYIGKWIFNSNEYMRLVSNWETDNPELVSVYGNRLLKYRYKKDST